MTTPHDAQRAVLSRAEAEDYYRRSRRAQGLPVEPNPTTEQVAAIAAIVRRVLQREKAA